MTDHKVPVTVTFASPGAQPPIFVAGQFSEWQPQEMEFTSDNGEHKFYKELIVKSGGEFQYKFRIGHGDWWVVDESSTIVNDGAGNSNNLLLAPEYKSQPTASELEKKIQEAQEAPVPLLIVEKVDDTKSHGDDFGPAATSEQKDAHEMREKDAQPDVEIVREEGNTTYSDTAAEVADIAAKLDQEPSPTPISDVEAGKSGERRLSLTPIQDVARTASEVADSAALLGDDVDDMETDRSGYKLSMPKRTQGQRRSRPLQLHGEDEDGDNSPDEDAIALFPHECPEVFDVEETEPPTPSHGPSRKMSIYDKEPVIDLNDPTIEQFPTDREGILTRIRTSSMSQSPSEEDMRALSFSPKVKSSRSSSRAQGPQTPLLDIISEEKNEPGHFKLPTSIQDAELSDHDENPVGLKKTLDSGISLDEMESKHTAAPKSTQDTKFPVKETGPAQIPSLTSAADMLSPVSALANHAVTPDTTSELAPKSNSGIATPVAATRNALDPVASLPEAVPTVAAGKDTSISDNSKSNDLVGKSDTAASTGISKANGNHSSALKARLNTTAVVKRSETPVSISRKSGEHAGLLRTIWQTIFIDWIGGFISRLCSGRSQV